MKNHGILVSIVIPLYGQKVPHVFCWQNSTFNCVFPVKKRWFLIRLAHGKLCAAHLTLKWRWRRVNDITTCQWRPLSSAARKCFPHCLTAYACSSSSIQYIRYLSPGPKPVTSLWRHDVPVLTYGFTARSINARVIRNAANLIKQCLTTLNSPPLETEMAYTITDSRSFIKHTKSHKT